MNITSEECNQSITKRKEQGNPGLEALKGVPDYIHLFLADLLGVLDLANEGKSFE